MPKQVTGPLVLCTAQPTNANWSSQEFPAAAIDTASFVIATAGITAASGEFKVKAKNTETGTWCTLDLTPAFTLANVNVTQPIVLTDLCFTKIRLDFIAGSGGDNGTFSVWFQGEGNV